MSNQEFQTINLNGEQVLARQVKLEDGTLQWRNKFGIALKDVKPVKQDELKAAPKAKRATRSPKKAAE
jgi:hypothetical protein